MFEAAKVIFLYAETPIHPGGSTGIGVIDNPIQREVQNNLPIMYGSGIKGAIKSVVRRDNSDDEFFALFGQDVTGSPDEHDSALAFLDAAVLAFPVKMAKGLFAWVTCLRQLALFQRALRYNHASAGLAFDMPSALEPLQCLAPEGCQDTFVILEESKYAVTSHHRIAQALAASIFPGQEDEYFRTHFQQTLLVIADEDFGYFTHHATELRARICIDDATGIVKNGALWIEEYLPSDTILFTVLLASRPTRQAFREHDADWARRRFEERMANFPRLQFGGNETIGKGLMRLTALNV
jgi:CRISPR-associated protein Cmr4